MESRKLQPGIEIVYLSKFVGRSSRSSESEDPRAKGRKSRLEAGTRVHKPQLCQNRESPAFLCFKRFN